VTSKLLSAARLTVGLTLLLVATSCSHIATGSHLNIALPAGVTLQEIDGGPGYFSRINGKSAWMDHHILLGAWLEQPLNATDVTHDRDMGDNIYWNLAGSDSDCNGVPCVASYEIIRNGGMHVSAPDVTVNSGSESVAYEGIDEADMQYGPGWDGWDKANNKCIPADGECGYTVARWYFTGQPTKLGNPGYLVDGTVKQQGFGKGVLFWESAKQAAEFLKFSDILSADSYWMTDGALNLASQGGCALFPENPKICAHGSGIGLTNAQRQLPANYAYNVTKLEQLQALNGASKPVIADVETGCPFTGDDSCTTPQAMIAAAWHALIAGARGILWFQHNFGGPCVDFRTILDGSNKESSQYDCQQTPGVTEHDVVQALTRFNSLVKSLNTVLLSPFADGYVSSDGDVSYMSKYVNGNFYIFAASGKPGVPPPDNQRVSFSITGAHNCSVNVLNEDRSIPVRDGKFSDVFLSDTSVHLYRVNC
jgi:hypothetical protein